LVFAYKKPNSKLNLVRQLLNPIASNALRAGNLPAHGGSFLNFIEYRGLFTLCSQKLRFNLWSVTERLSAQT
jgi:hypothetical protein